LIFCLKIDSDIIIPETSSRSSLLIIYFFLSSPKIQVAWFMTVTSIISPPQENVVHNAPQNFESFILGAVALLFTYGGHTSNIEVADVMDNPAAYDR